MKIIENIFIPKKHVVHTKYTVNNTRHDEFDDLNMRNNDEGTNFDEDQKELISQQIDKLLSEVKTKESLENFSKNVSNMITKTNSAYIKPSLNNSQFLIGQKQNKTNIRTISQNREKENSSSLERTNINNMQVEENVGRSSSMPSKVMNAVRDKKKLNQEKSNQNSRDISPFDISGRNPNHIIKNISTVREGKDNTGQKINVTDYSDFDIEMAS